MTHSYGWNLQRLQHSRNKTINTATVMVATGRITAAEPIDPVCSVAPVCPTPTEYTVPWAHAKWHLDQFSHFAGFTNVSIKYFEKKLLLNR